MRTRTLLLPLLVILVAAAPGMQGLLARDGKAKAIEAGHLRVEQAQEQAVAEGLADNASAALPLPGAECSDGMAGPYPCENVDLLSIVPIPEIGAAVGSDVWGWTDAETEREIVITTTTFGAAFVDVTDPTSPVVLGRIQQLEPADSGVLWRDVKVYADHAYLVSEHAGGHLIVFDLTQLREVTSDQGVFQPTTVYEEFGSAHNIAINTETGFAYAVGTDTCEGGLHMIDLSSPAEPTFAGCFEEDGYTHDVQCVIYRGPDAEFQGSEICFAANEDTVTIVDVTDKSSPEMLSRTTYDTFGYTHQGWLTPEHDWFVFGDELDEEGPLSRSEQPVPNTATYIMQVDDLRQPDEVKTFLHETKAIDHNLYIEDGYIWQANYTAGLRVMDYDQASLAAGELEQVAFFDVDPGEDGAVFAGAWTAYPFFESGTIALNSFDSGLFLLRATLDEQTDEPPAPAPEDDQAPAPAPETGDTQSGLPATGGGIATGLLGLVLLSGAALLRRSR